MGNKAIDLRPKQITVILDRERNIQFDFNAAAALEDAFGMSLVEALDEIQKGAKIDIVKKMLWAGLATDIEETGKPLELKQLPKYISITSLTELSPLLLGALLGSLPEPEANPKNSKAPPKK